MLSDDTKTVVKQRSGMLGYWCELFYAMTKFVSFMFCDNTKFNSLGECYVLDMQYSFCGSSVSNIFSSLHSY